VVDGAAFRCTDSSLLHVSLYQGNANDATCKFTDLHLSMFGLSAQWRAEAAQREAANEVTAVRALAHCHRNSDPGFSSDLYAAADRFERERPDPV
jgi:hypothetical protein